MVKKYKRVLVVLWVIALCLSVCAAYITFFDRGFTEVCFVSVGQGDSCLIKTNKGDNILIDGGDSGSGEYTLSALFRREFVLNLDAVFVSHMHSDHIRGICELIQDGFNIDKIYVSDKAHNEKGYSSLAELAETERIEIETLSVDDKVSFRDVVFTVIASGSEYDLSEENDYSMVVRMDYGENSFLFTGDATKSLEKEIADRQDIDVDFLKVAHHGSYTSSGIEFVQNVSPIMAVISVGEDNKYGLPSESTLKNMENLGIPVMRTDESGNITVRMTRDDILAIEEGRKKENRK